LLASKRLIFGGLSSSSTTFLEDLYYKGLASSLPLHRGFGQEGHCEGLYNML
jgi:hypothetical protein